MNVFPRLAAIIGVFTCLTMASVAHAQQEFPPPQGKGRVVVLASGTSGPAHDTTVAREIAELGYDVVLFDGNQMAGTHGDGVKADILEAQQMPHALPGKVVLVGFSLGGGMCLYFATQWPDLVAGAVLWYPENSFIHDPPGFASRLKVPVLMFAGAMDHYRNDGSSADKDRTLAAGWRRQRPRPASRSNSSSTRKPITISSRAAITIARKTMRTPSSGPPTGSRCTWEISAQSWPYSQPNRRFRRLTIEPPGTKSSQKNQHVAHFH